MTLSRPPKILIGALTIWPIAYGFVFVGFVVLSFVAIAQGELGRASASGGGPPIWFVTLMVAHVGTMAIALALTAFYVVFLFQTNRVEQSHKALWAVALFMGGVVAQPIFFWLYVWPERWPAADPPLLPQPASRPRSL